MPTNRSINLNQNVEVLEVQIKDKTYQIPLASSLPYKKVKALMKLAKNENEEEQLDAFIEFFKEHIPEEVIDDLPMSSLTALAKAWAGVTEKESGQTLGE